MLQEQSKGFIGVAAVKWGIPGSFAFGHHVVAHAADVFARMPERDRHAGTEQRRDPRAAAAEMKVARPENDRIDVSRDMWRLFHGLR